jgi:hypothetical protein
LTGDTGPLTTGKLDILIKLELSQRVLCTKRPFFSCLFPGISILFLYLYQITFFGGWLAIYGRFEKANRHAVTGRKTMTLAEASECNCWL